MLKIVVHNHVLLYLESLGSFMHKLVIPQSELNEFNHMMSLYVISTLQIWRFYSIKMYMPSQTTLLVK